MHQTDLSLKTCFRTLLRVFLKPDSILQQRFQESQTQKHCLSGPFAQRESAVIFFSVYAER